MDEVALIYCRLGYFMLKHVRLFYFHVVNIFIAEHTHKILNMSKWIKRIALLLQLPPCCCSWAMLVNFRQHSGPVLEKTTLASSHGWSLLITSAIALAGMAKDSVPVIPHALQGFFSHVMLQSDMST